MIGKWKCCNGKYTWINIVDMLGINARLLIIIIISFLFLFLDPGDLCL